MQINDKEDAHLFICLEKQIKTKSRWVAVQAWGTQESITGEYEYGIPFQGTESTLELIVKKVEKLNEQIEHAKSKCLNPKWSKINLSNADVV